MQTNKTFRSILSLFLFCSSFFATQSFAQNKMSQPAVYDSLAKQIITTGLRDGKAYEMLYEMCTKIGPRLSGSPQAAKAVVWCKKKMDELGFQNVHLQPVMVPHWVRGPIEKASLISSQSKKNIPLHICALGGSISTPSNGITAEVIEVKSFDELKKLGDAAKGKIIFFNRPLDRSKINPGEAYGGAVNQRWGGAIEAAKVGGVAALVRSMTMKIDDKPHTGSMGYVDSVRKVPSAAISTKDANMLSDLLQKEKHVKVNMKLTCETLPDAPSDNVIGEIVGSEKPDEIVVIGGHLDSWDKGQGAHDDGAGCIHSIEALRLIKQLGLKPKRTIRAVMFINEENGLRGGKEYADKLSPKEKHIAAIESDAGGFAPYGFGVGADSLTVEKISRWASLFKIIDADHITNGGGGVDISPLGPKGVPLIGLHVDGQKYFDYHHSDNDTIDGVHERELELGAAAVAILAYVLAQEGI